MNCDPRLVSSYHDGDLSSEQASRIRQHIDECPECQRTLAAFRAVSAAIRGLPEETAPAFLPGNVRREIALRTRKRTWRRLIPVAAQVGVALAAVAVLVVALGPVLNRQMRLAAPAVVAATPGLGSVDVGSSSAIRVVFNTDMDRQTVESSVGISPPLKVQMEWEGSDLLLVPMEPMQPNTTYQVAVNSSARDSEGRFIERPFSLQFATAPYSSDGPVVAMASASKVSETRAAGWSTAQPTARSTVVLASYETPAKSSESSTSLAPGNVQTAVSAPALTRVAGTPVPQSTAVALGTSVAHSTMVAALSSDPVDHRHIPMGTPTDQGLLEVELTSRSELSAKLGAALSEATYITATTQPYEGGQAFAWGGSIVLMLRDGRWKAHVGCTPTLTDTTSGSSSSGQVAPGAPFACWWQESAEVRGTIGWALQEMAEERVEMQRFAGGFVVLRPGGVLYALYGDGRWQRLPSLSTVDYSP